jgi:hypothetical protein
MCVRVHGGNRSTPPRNTTTHPKNVDNLLLREHVDQSDACGAEHELTAIRCAAGSADRRSAGIRLRANRWIKRAKRTDR